MAERRSERWPSPLPGNPGAGAEAQIEFSTGDRSWTEEVNLVDLLARVLQERGYAVTPHETWLEHPDSGFVLLPQLVAFQPLEQGGVRTVTTIQTHHRRLVPDGVFEYQHAAGDTIENAIRSGLDQWVQTDFVALLETLRPRPETCTTLEMEFPETGGKPARLRRAILGPVAHFMANPPPEGGAEEEHPFCPCCLLTNTFQAFKDLLEDDAFCGLRFFAARDDDGEPQADCRVSGEDFEPGAEALREYVRTWPGEGYEFRKQYVVLQTIEKPQGADG
jgi:hypothetical protein